MGDWWIIGFLELRAEVATGSNEKIVHKEDSKMAEIDEEEEERDDGVDVLSSLIARCGSGLFDIHTH